jgi:hypothetical protein
LARDGIRCLQSDLFMEKPASREATRGAWSAPPDGADRIGPLLGSHARYEGSARGS